jgi:hypothetical protein
VRETNQLWTKSIIERPGNRPELPGTAYNGP